MARISTRGELFKICSVIATIPACFLLFYSGYTLVKYAGVMHTEGLVKFGILPLVGGVCWFVLAAWCWSRAVGAASVWDSMGVIAVRVAGAIGAVWVILVVVRVVER